MTITLNLPQISNINEFDAKMILAGELYERGKLSLGQAAKLASVSKRTFIEIMGNYGYFTFGNEEEEILNDVATNY